MLMPSTRIDHRVIREIVAQRYGVTVEEMLSKSREMRHTTPRHIGMFLAIHAGYSLPRAALAFNRDDHTTAIYARNRVKKFMREKPEFAALVQSLADECGLEPVEIAA